MILGVGGGLIMMLSWSNKTFLAVKICLVMRNTVKLLTATAGFVRIITCKFTVAVTGGYVWVEGMRLEKLLGDVNLIENTINFGRDNKRFNF